MIHFVLLLLSLLAAPSQAAGLTLAAARLLYKKEGGIL